MCTGNPSKADHEHDNRNYYIQCDKWNSCHEVDSGQSITQSPNFGEALLSAINEKLHFCDDVGSFEKET